MMNNRIRYLAQEAGFNAFTTFIMPNHQGHISTELEKFAELIVRECAQIVNDNDFAGSTMGNRLLFEHFGIEE